MKKLFIVLVACSMLIVTPVASALVSTTTPAIPAIPENQNPVSQPNPGINPDTSGTDTNSSIDDDRVIDTD